MKERKRFCALLYTEIFSKLRRYAILLNHGRLSCTAANMTFTGPLAVLAASCSPALRAFGTSLATRALAGTLTHGAVRCIFTAVIAGPPPAAYGAVAYPAAHKTFTIVPAMNAKASTPTFGAGDEIKLHPCVGETFLGMTGHAQFPCAYSLKEPGLR